MAFMKTIFEAKYIVVIMGVPFEMESSNGGLDMVQFEKLESTQQP
jgi:hypothetical protein